MALLAALVPPTGARAMARSAPAFHDATAVIETPSLFDDVEGGEADADDPAIWVHPTHREASLVIGTAKNAGLRVYDLRGREVQTIPTLPTPGPNDAASRFNNVDLVSGFWLGSRRVDLAVVTDRGRDRLRVYRIDPRAAARNSAPLVDVTVPDVPPVFAGNEAEINEQNTAYGLATFTNGKGAFAVVSQRNRTTLHLMELVAQGDQVGYRRVDALRLPATLQLPTGAVWAPCGEPGELPQVEGMVADPAAGALYAAQEDVGFWSIGITSGRFTGVPRLIDQVREYGVPASYNPETEECTVHRDQDPGAGGSIAADVEGLTIYQTGQRGGVVLASGQGNSTFHAYDRISLRPLGRFRVVEGPRVDGAEHSDGAAVVATPLPGFPAGLLVVQDGADATGTPAAAARATTNYKYIDWRLVLDNTRSNS
ncbi:MAG: phytase [Micromonosporaceae bacterium]|nr:phytase [Micromonosporaceae bacterium]